MTLDALRATAQEGLSYAENEYDRARYRKLLGMASEKYAEITGLNAETIRKVFLREHGSITPKVGVDVAVPNHKGEILAGLYPARFQRYAAFSGIIPRGRLWQR